MLQTQAQQFNIPLFVSIGCAIIIFFVFFFYLLIIQANRRRIIHQKEIAELKVRYDKTILQSQLEIQEQTFRNISQDIHDNIGQVLSLAKLNLNTIPENESSNKIALTEELLGKAINDLRDISKSLHPEKIIDIGLINAISQELLLVQKVAKIKTELICLNGEINLGSEKTIIVFRMMQEILQNILKHANAFNVTVEIGKLENKTLITVKDDGKGFMVDALKSTETGIGLKSIKQRCDLVNASFKIHSTPGKGTSVQLTILNS